MVSMSPEYKKLELDLQSATQTIQQSEEIIKKLHSQMNDINFNIREHSNLLKNVQKQIDIKLFPFN